MDLLSKKYAQAKEIAELKAENFELKESLKCFQTPEVTKALTFYKTGEFDLQEKNCFELQNKIDELETELRVAKMNRLTMFEKLDIVDENTRLKLENEQLKEELETRDNLIEHFRKEAINWAKIANDCIKDIEKYKQTLQEIKGIAERCINKDTCYDCEYSNDCYIEDAEIPTYDICKLVLQLITKAEEE